MKTFWFSFADGHKAKGKRFVGVVIVDATTLDRAFRKVQDIVQPELHYHAEAHPLGSLDKMDQDYAALLRRTPRDTLLTREQLTELGHEPG